MQSDILSPWKEPGTMDEGCTEKGKMQYVAISKFIALL